MKTISSLTRRQWLGCTAALGASVAVPSLTVAAQARSSADAPATDLAAVEHEATTFDRPLRLPGSSGLYGVMRAADVRELRVTRTDVEILPGRRTPYLAYVAEAQGKRFVNPALLARRGDEIRLRMVNQLAEPTIIHWHGLRNSAHNDGNGLVLAAPGGAHEYAFKVDDRASMYWYHPHPHGFIPQQAYHGLAGLLFVEDDEEAALRSALDLTLGESEIPIVLQDRNFDAQGRLSYAPSTQEGFQGFIGERLLVNLTDRPVMQASRRIYRFRMLNGSNARTYRLAFVQGGRRVGYFIAGTDGGLLAAPRRAEQAFISPGQRLDILLDLREAKSDGPVTLATLAFDPMHAEWAGETAGGSTDHSTMSHGAGGEMAMEGAPRALLRIDLKPASGYARTIPARLSTLAAFRDKPGMPRRMRLGHDGKGNWTINGRVFDPSVPTFTVKRGTIETWIIENDRRSMPHPMHLHGFAFRVSERQGSPQEVRALAGPKGLLPQDLGLLDTVHVWPGEAVHVVLDFSHSYPGDQDYVFHCHNLEHAERGMMARYRVKA